MADDAYVNQGHAADKVLVKGKEIGGKLYQGVILYDESGNVALYGSPSRSISQVATSGTEVSVASARTTRRSCTIKNIGNITVYVGPTGVTSSNGFPLEPGEAISFSTTGQLFAISSSDSTVAVWDEYV